jgi:hypothetical protein
VSPLVVAVSPLVVGLVVELMGAAAALLLGSIVAQLDADRPAPRVTR